MTSTACPAESASEDTNPVGTLCEMAEFIGARNCSARNPRKSRRAMLCAPQNGAFCRDLRSGWQRNGLRHIKNQS